MGNPTRVCVVTGTRAEYGLLTPLLRGLADAPDFELQLIATGTHLSLLHGQTVQQIRADGFRLSAEIAIVLASDSRSAVVKSMGLFQIELATHLDRLHPDYLLLLGDRWEVLAAASAATVLGIPVVHIHGGEVTEGAFDDSIRHAVTKLARLHFVAAEEFQRRILQMGEEPASVHVVGPAALETIRGMAEPSVEETLSGLGLEHVANYCMVAYHPATTGAESTANTMRALLEAALRVEDLGTVLVVSPNADPAYAEVVREVELAQELSDRIVPLPSVGHLRYLSLLKFAAVIVGNSSSALIEAPSLATPSVLVGTRQDGRPLAASVLRSEPTTDAIVAAIQKALTLPPELLEPESSLYAAGVSFTDSVLRVLRSTTTDALRTKRFRDITFS